MKTKNSTVIGQTRTRGGKVTVVNAVASIHKILAEIAPQGKVYCQMETSDTGACFTFTSNGIKATFSIQEGGK